MLAEAIIEAPVVEAEVELGVELAMNSEGEGDMFSRPWSLLFPLAGGSKSAMDGLAFEDDD